jgi:hypothetical protein
VIDQNDETEAQEVVEKACDESVRRAALSILAEAIKEANVYGRDRWALRVEETARLVVGNYYVCTLRETGVWLALDDRFTKTADYHPTMEELDAWGWTPDEPGRKGSYPSYKDRSRRTDFSINGRYTIGANHADAWPHIRKLFFDFIYKAIHHGQPMNPKSPALHSQGMLKYMRHYLGVDLPDPLYQPGAR